MAVTIEIDAGGIRIVDTAVNTGPVPGPSFVTSLAVAEWVLERRVVLTGVSNQALSFGTVGAAKVIAITSDVEITLKLDGESTGHAGKKFLVVNEDGDMTAATISNASGSTATIQILIAGAS